MPVTVTNHNNCDAKWIVKRWGHGPIHWWFKPGQIRQRVELTPILQFIIGAHTETEKPFTLFAMEFNHPV